MAVEIYANHLTERTLLYTTNGDSPYDIVPGIVKNEINKSGSFEFDIYQSSERHFEFREKYHYISVEDTSGFSTSDSVRNYRYMFFGRVIQIEAELSGKWHVQCEGLMVDLLDFPMYNDTTSSTSHSSAPEDPGIHNLYVSTTGELFTKALTAYERVRAEIFNDVKPLINYDGVHSSVNLNASDMLSDKNYFEYMYPWSQSIGDFITSELVNKYGGILLMDYDYDSQRGIYGKLSWKADPNVYSDEYPVAQQKILFQKNVLDAKVSVQNIDKPEGVFGVGKYEVDSGGEGYYWSEDSTRSGYIFPFITWGSDMWGSRKAITAKVINFENVGASDVLVTRTNRYASIYCTGLTNQVTAKVADAHFVIDPNIPPISILEKYHVRIPIPYRNIDETMLCLSSEIDITNPANNTYVFGTYETPEIMDARYITRHDVGSYKLPNT